MNLSDETLMLNLIYLTMQQTDLEYATGIDTYKLAAKSDLASLKAEIN